MASGKPGAVQSEGWRRRCDTVKLTYGSGREVVSTAQLDVVNFTQAVEATNLLRVLNKPETLAHPMAISCSTNTGKR